MRVERDASQTRFAILGMLTLGPASGYGLKKLCEESLSHFWHESFGNLYPRLAALEEEGLVRSRRERRPGRPDAFVYTLTERGRHALMQWLASPAAPERIRSEVLLKVYFGAQAPVELTVRQITSYREQQEQLREVFAGFEESLRGRRDGSPDIAFRMMTLRRGQLLNEARIRWCDESLATLASMKKGRAQARRTARGESDAL